MALFGSKKKSDAVEKPAAKAVVPVREVRVKKTTKAVKVVKVSSEVAGGNFTDPGIIIQPRITEKATFQAEVNNVYVFEIRENANKKMVKSAVAALYKVKPVKVRMVKNPAKRVFVRGKWGRKPGVKKAYVTLAKGDKIEIA